MKRTRLRTTRPAWAKYPSSFKDMQLVCEVCGDPFMYTATGGFRPKTCSPRCQAESKRAKMRASDRRGARNPNHRHGRRAGVRDRAAEQRWYSALGARCQNPACVKDQGGYRSLSLHHIVYRQEVKRAHGDVWDPRNGFTTCDSCHMSHHRRGTKIIPLSALPDSAFEFAAETLGTGYAYEYLRRRYAGDDPRLDELIAE